MKSSDEIDDHQSERGAGPSKDPARPHPIATMSVPSITKSDGVRMKFDVNPDADCCVKCMWYHWIFGCCPMGMTQEAKTEQEVAGTAKTHLGEWK